MKYNVQVIAEITPSEESALALGLARHDSKWHPINFVNKNTGRDVLIPRKFAELKDAEAKKLDEAYISMLFNELHHMLAQSEHTPEDMVADIDRLHHDYNIAVHMDRMHAQPDGPPCNHVHPVDRNTTLKYVAEYGAPGRGRAFKCHNCDEEFAVIGLRVHPASEGAHIMNPDDVI